MPCFAHDRTWTQILQVGLGLAFVLTVPAWGFYRRHKPKWQPALYPDNTEADEKVK